MESTIKNPRIKFNVSSLMMLFCIFSFTVGQAIPIYFVNNGLRNLFYSIIFVILVIIISRKTFKLVYKPQKNNISLARLISILVGFVAFLVFGFFTLGISITVWTESKIYYVDKDNSKIKIISRYLDSGAFGGGTESGDYHIILLKPLSNFFNLETSIDTTLIDKTKWVRPKD
jgi:hypothetical protein